MQRIQTLPNILRGSGGIHAGHLPACVMGGLLCGLTHIWVTHQRTGPSIHTLTSSICLSVWTWEDWWVLTDVCKRRFTKSKTRNTSWVLEPEQNWSKLPSGETWFNNHLCCGFTFSWKEMSSRNRAGEFDDIPPPVRGSLYIILKTLQGSFSFVQQIGSFDIRPM